MLIIAGDIGGTKTHLALARVEGNVVKIEHQATFQSKNYPNLGEMIRGFQEETISKVPGNARFACFGVAGPVRDGVVQVTNLPWTVEASRLREQLNLDQVFLLNDLEANAYGIQTLSENELVSINPRADFAQVGNRALISAGTGLGEAGLYWDGKRHRPFATEGGHASFAPNDSIGDELLVFLRKERGHVSWERVLSGLGMQNLYRFFRHRSGVPEPEWLQARLAKEDKNAVVSQVAHAGEDPVCLEAIDYFVQNYGAEAGNLALKTLSIGGLYIGGGIAPKMLEKMQSGLFFNAFCHKGRLSPLLESMPVYIILNQKTALHGAAWYAAEWAR